MKYLILTVCMSAALAAPPYKPYQKPSQVTAQALAVVQPVPVQPVVKSAPVVVPPVGHSDEYSAEVLRSVSDVRPDGGYGWELETSNGITAQASGALKKVDDQEAVVVQGSYKYTGPDGVPVEVVYVADENGFQPQSNVLPTPPPVPEAIARALEYIAAHPPVEN